MNSQIARDRTGDGFRQSTYCPFCGRTWRNPSDRIHCIRIVSPGLDDEFYRYYRQGSCYEHQIQQLQRAATDAEKKTRATLDKVANLRDALKALNI